MAEWSLPDYELLARRLDRVLPPGQSTTPSRTNDPLVNAAILVARGPTLEMSAEAFMRIQSQVMQTADATLSPVRPMARPAKRPMPVRVWLAAASFLVVIFIAGLLPATAASLPGDSLYPVKQAIEKVELALASSDKARAYVHMQQAERRAVEANGLIQRGRFDSNLLFASLDSMAAAAAAARADGDPALTNALEARTRQVTAVLYTVIQNAEANGLASSAQANTAEIDVQATHDSGALLVPATSTPTVTPTPIPTIEPTSIPPTETPRPTRTPPSVPASLPTAAERAPQQSGQDTESGTDSTGTAGNANGNSNGNATGNANGNANGNASGNSNGTATGNANGNATGASSGNATGNSTGNSSGNSNGSASGNLSGSNGNANGSANGSANGDSNGSANGNSDGNANGNAQEEPPTDDVEGDDNGNSTGNADGNANGSANGDSDDEGNSAGNANGSANENSNGNGGN